MTNNTSVPNESNEGARVVQHEKAIDESKNAVDERASMVVAEPTKIETTTNRLTKKHNFKK